jgi:hypothetical protein
MRRLSQESKYLISLYGLDSLDHVDYVENISIFESRKHDDRTNHRLTMTRWADSMYMYRDASSPMPEATIAIGKWIACIDSIQAEV